MPKQDLSNYDFSKVPYAEKPHHTSATAIDSETSSLHPYDIPEAGIKRGGLVELAGLSHDHLGNERGRFETLVNPGNVDYNPAAMAKNGISMDDIAKAPNIMDVLPEYVKWIKSMHESKPWQTRDGKQMSTPSTHLVGHNHTNFDIPYIEAAIRQHTPKLYPEWKALVRQPWDTMQHGGPYTAQPGLQSEGERHGIFNNRQHRAMGDVEQTMGLYHQQRGKQRLLEHFMNQGGVDIPKNPQGNTDIAQHKMTASQKPSFIDMIKDTSTGRKMAAKIKWIK